MALRFQQIELSSAGNHLYPTIAATGSGQLVQIQSAHGYLQLGSNNTSYAHFQTDRPNFYFNQVVKFDGSIAGYDGDETAQFATYYDSNNTSYYVNPAGDSEMNQIWIDDYIRHRGDIHTYFGFTGNDAFAMVFEGTTRLSVADSTDPVFLYNAHINMSGKDIDQVNQLHFQDNVRFYDNGDDNYLNFKFGDTSHGGIKMIDGGGNLHGYIYADGNDNIGFLDADGNWAVYVSKDDITGLKVNDVYRVKADTSGVLLGADTAASKTIVRGHLGIGDASYPKIAYPGQNALWGGSGSTTGQIVIDLPGTLANFDMMYMEIDIYEYSGAGASKLIIGGHNWNSNGNSNTSTTQWYNVNVQVVGPLSKAVYFGRRNDGSNERRCIAIGETTSTWSYATVHVAKVHGAEFYSTAIDWVGDWNIAQTTSTSYFTKNPTTNFNDGGSYTLESNGIIEANHTFGAVSSRAPIFYDLDNTSYYVNPAGTSVINDIEIEDYIYHKGDTDTYLYFEPDSIKLRTGGTDRLTLTNTQASLGTDLVISSAGTGGSPCLRINNLNHTTFNHGIEVYNGNLVQGESEIILVGKTGSTKNSGYLGYYWHADGSDDNFVTIGHYGNNHLFRVYGSGSVVATTNMQAPIFYDSNDTTYFMDLASTSTGLKTAGEAQVKSLRLGNNFTLNQGGSNYAQLGSWIDVLAVGLYSSSVNGAHIYPNQSSDYGAWRMDGTRNNWNGITFAHSSVFNTLMSNNVTMGLYNDSDNEWYVEATRNSYVRLYYNGTEQARADNGFFFANNQMRSPIFYDSNNTSYYLNPADTSTSLATAGKWFMQGSHSAARIQLNYAHGGSPATDNGSTALTLWASEPGITYNGAGIGVNIHVNGQYYGRAYDTQYGAYIRFDKSNGAIEGWTTQGNAGTSGGQGTKRWHSDNGGNFYGVSSVRAPLFYDSNDTNYYVDAADQSRLKTLNLGNSPGSGVASGYHLHVRGAGIHMDNNNIDYVNQLHFHDNVRFYDDGNDSHLNFKWGDTGAGGIKFIDGDGDLQGHVYGAGNGRFGLLDKDGSWVLETDGASFTGLRSNGNEELIIYNDRVEIPGDIRAPIFYDRNDTGYYVNPAGSTVLETVTAGTLNLVNVNASQGIKAPNQRTNYVANKWVAGTTFPQAAVFDGNFNANGPSSENVLEYGVTPSGGRGLLWKATNNDATSNADGGWAKNISNLSDDKAYISICYVKRVGSSTNGSFYHGCHGSHTLNMAGTADTNPYFIATNIGNLAQDVWCVSIGIIQANNDSNQNSWSDIDGVYRLDTGERILDTSTFKMKDGSTAQSHRTYLYYSTDSNAELHWYNPGFYEINGQEPTLNEILNRDKNLKLHYTGSRFIASDTPDYWGAGNTVTNDSWKWFHNGGDLKLQVRESGQWYDSWQYTSALVAKGHTIYSISDSNYYIDIDTWYSLRKGRITEHLSVGNGTGSQVDTTKAALQVYGNNNTDGTVRLGPHSSKGPNFSHIHYGSNGDWYIRPAADDGKIVIADSDADQSVGVGTSSPSAKLDVEATTGTGYIAEFRNLHQTDGNGVFIKCNAQDSGMVILDTQDGGGSSIFKVQPAVVTVAQDSQLRASRSTTTDSVGAAAASFIDHNVGSGNRATIAMEANSYQGAKHIEFYQGTTLNGSISSGYNGTGFNTSSDYRLKENVSDLSDALTKVDLLLPKTFTWKGGDENRIVQGFLAHEAQEVVPESVTGTKDETDENGKAIYQGIDQAKLVPLLTAAIKELKAQNEDLLDRVKALENK